MRAIYVPVEQPAELNQGGTSTSEKVFQDADNVAVMLALPTGFLGSSTSVGKQCRRIRITVGGRVTGGTTTNFTPQLQFTKHATPTTSTNNTDIESGAAVAVNSNSGLWEISAELILVVTGTGTARIEGYCCQLIGGSTRTFTAVAVSDNSITTYDPTQVTPRTGFVVTGTFSSGHASNAAYLDYAVMEVLG